MNRTKIIFIGALMAAVATVFQSIPALLSESFALLTTLSAIPVYLAARTNPAAGALSYFTTAVLVLFVSSHEALFFLFTNGVVGVSLGICCYLKQKKINTLVICAFVLTIALCIINYGIGYPVLGVPVPGVIIVQLLILFLFSLIYNYIFLAFADFVYKKIKDSGITDIGSSE